MEIFGINIMMKAGTYYVGDLCYVMKDRWDEFCTITIVENDCLEGEFQLLDGIKFASYSTLHGDGLYRDKEGRQYPVDAGLIGCIRVEDIPLSFWQENRGDVSCGNVIEFPHDFSTESFQGRMHFGHVYIDTAEEFYEEEEKDFDY